jgi:tetratricopeptide (TPR) repeat protein
VSAVWELVKAQQFEEACIQADKEWLSSQSAFPLRNKIFALLNLGRFEEAVIQCEQIIQLVNGSTDSDFIFLGVAYWLQEMHSEATRAWKEALKAKYTDAAGGVEAPLLLLYASARLSDKKLFELSMNMLKKWKGKVSRNWPGAIASMALGAISADELLLQIESQHFLREKQACQAYFHIGVQFLIKNNTEQFINSMKNGCAQGVFSYSKAEFYLSRFEFFREM